jgi:hypothetical protein
VKNGVKNIQAVAYNGTRTVCTNMHLKLLQNILDTEMFLRLQLLLTLHTYTIEATMTGLWNWLKSKVFSTESKKEHIVTTRL